MHFSGKAILLDIEGTTSSISFVHDEMFPLVRAELESFLKQQWDEVDVQLAIDQIAQDAGHDSITDWAGDSTAEQRSTVTREVLRLMDNDVKATGLKQLQGLIWRQGFESGQMQAHVYPDVPPSLQRWREAGMELRIYSSGSVQAQKLFFGHTLAGNLLGHFTGHYDTTIGSKRESVSYEKIARDWQIEPSEILFISDVVAELDAAGQSQFATALSIRPGNAAIDQPQSHPAIESFSEIQIQA